MKIAVVGSRNLIVEDIEKYLPCKPNEIVSGGARGVDACAKRYAIENNIKLTEFLPDYKRYGRIAALRRNLDIINYADIVVALWDGRSKGTKNVIDNCKRINKKVIVYYFNA